MTWAVLFAIVAIIVFLVAFSGQKQVAWSDKLRRLNAGVSYQAEWMAPEYVIQQVRNDYLMAARWLRECSLQTWAEQWNAAANFLDGAQLQRHHAILNSYRIGRPPRYRDILIADHNVTVRHFSENGERCLVIDQQTQRTVISLDYHSYEPFITQALEDAVLVYQMRYDKETRRWKIEQFIQTLPRGWRADASGRVKLYASLPPTNGRDH